TPAATRAKFAALLTRLHAHPVTVGTPPDTLACDDLCAAISVPLAQVSEWKDAAEQLQQLWTASATGRRAASATLKPSTLSAPAPGPYAGREQTDAVLCSDSANPRDPRAYTAADRLVRARSGIVGLQWVWPSEVCAQWPAGQDAYNGPW